MAEFDAVSPGLDLALPVHGGTDALGVPQHDFSTNRNACGPCPRAVTALAAAHVAQYPDPAYTALRHQLAAFHGVEAERVLIAGSASEFIHRFTAHVRRAGATHASVPVHSYGDYAHAAQVWGLALQHRPQDAAPQGQGLHWACAPSSPLGSDDGARSGWTTATEAGAWRVLDCAYAPLVLGERLALPPEAAGVWQLWTPNKALGMTGVRAAYAIAPVQTAAGELAALQALAPSWVLGAHGVALLQAWTCPDVQAWLADSRERLAAWKALQADVCAELGWQLLPGALANYQVARWPAAWQGAPMAQALAALRRHGIKLRDASSFGLPGCVRLGVLSPRAQQALVQAWRLLPTP